MLRFFNYLNLQLRLAAFLLLANTLMVTAQVPDHEMKAFYIEKLTRYIIWPNNSGAENSKPFVISIIGRSPFRNSLENLFKTKKIQGRKVEIKYINTIEEALGTQLLFVAGTEKQKLRPIVQFAKDKPILTISDTEGFCETGIYINFYIDDDDKLKFEINETRIREAGFKVDLLLFEISKIVNPMVKR